MYIFLPRVLNENFSIFIVFFFEFFGTFLYAYLNFCLLNAKAQTKNETRKMLLFYVDFSLSLFICVAYGRSFSGGVYNPATTFFRMLRRIDRVSIKMGFITMTAQFLGASLGSFIAVELYDFRHAPITGLLSSHEQIIQFSSEVFSTFILTFMAQFMVDKKMTFIEHNQEFYIAAPLFYMIARAYSATSNGVNPATGFSFEFAFAIKTGKWQVMYMTYILVFGPYAGALIAVFLYQFALKPLFPLKKEEIQNILVQELKKKETQMRGKQMKEEEIDNFKKDYIEAALQIGIVIKLEPEQERQSLQPGKKPKINHRFTLGQIVMDEALPPPKDYQYLNLVNVIQEEDYFDDDIDSIEDEQEVILDIKKQDRIVMIEQGLQQPLYMKKDQRRQATTIRIEHIQPQLENST